MKVCNLFALTTDPSSRVVRIPLGQSAQDEVTQIFRAQELEFNSRAKTEISFDGKYKPDYEECLCIDSYDDIDGLSQAILNPLAIHEIDPSPIAFSSVKAIFSGYQDAGKGARILMQVFEKRRILSPSGNSFFYSGNVYTKIENVGLTLDNKLTAIVSEKKLRFFSFHFARQILDLSQYYTEATDNDIQDFVALNMVHVENAPGFVGMADTWVRRKIALIKQSGVLDNVALDTMRKAASDFGIDFVTQSKNGQEAIVLPDSKPDLKKLLRFLDEDYYKSVLLSKSYLTNSKIAL